MNFFFYFIEYMVFLDFLVIFDSIRVCILMGVFLVFWKFWIDFFWRWSLYFKREINLYWIIGEKKIIVKTLEKIYFFLILVGSLRKFFKVIIFFMLFCFWFIYYIVMYFKKMMLLGFVYWWVYWKNYYWEFK